MNQNEIIAFRNRAADGQQIRVTAKSGRIFDGVYNAEETDEQFLYFDTFDGNELRAEWENIVELDYRNPAAMARSLRMFAPPEHPLSGQGPTGVRSDGVPLRPHTTRNR